MPYPDFWVSALYKRLVGTAVLGVTNHVNTGNKVRLYAHCAKDGSVVLFGINMSDQKVSVDLEEPLSKSAVNRYELSPPGGVLTSGDILLNDKPMRLVDKATRVPDFVPATSGPVRSLDMAAYGMAFWTFPQLQPEICADSLDNSV